LIQRRERRKNFLSMRRAAGNIGEGDMPSTGPAQTGVVIIGAGFAGIGLAIKLKTSGFTDFVILEKSASIGGVWNHNRYPGAACDVPSHLYSFSFEPRADWPERYASQAEILKYLKQCVQKYDLAPSHILFGAEVSEARWREDAARWTVRTADGRDFDAQALVTATGQLSRPLVPHLEGLKDFSGAAFHSAQWPDGCDLSGKSVAVVGTGASAIQVVPSIAPLAGKLYVFQRSAAYVLPKPDKTYSRLELLLFKHVPGALKLSRLWMYLQHEARALAFVTWRAALKAKQGAFLRYLERRVGNLELRRRLIPNYSFGCKRILLSNDFFAAVARDNVELVTHGIREIRPRSIVDLTGTQREVDVIIFATGFSATGFLVPMKITGIAGRDLHQSWKEGAEAYLGISVSGFPNLFMLYGPNTNLAHNSIIYMLESQIRYVMACLRRLRRGDIRVLDVKKTIQEGFNARIQRRLQKSVWAKGCTSWYLTASRKNTTNWPGYTLGFRLQTRAPRWDDYVVQ
jgi:cation diffusion facilitator CzcD-associated flavoprotein CzcO